MALIAWIPCRTMRRAGRVRAGVPRRDWGRLRQVCQRGECIVYGVPLSMIHAGGIKQKGATYWEGRIAVVADC